MEAAFAKAEQETAEAIRKLNMAEASHVQIWLEAHIEADADWAGWPLVLPMLTNPHSRARSFACAALSKALMTTGSRMTLLAMMNGTTAMKIVFPITH